MKALFYTTMHYHRGLVPFSVGQKLNNLQCDLSQNPSGGLNSSNFNKELMKLKLHGSKEEDFIFGSVKD